MICSPFHIIYVNIIDNGTRTHKEYKNNVSVYSKSVTMDPSESLDDMLEEVIQTEFPDREDKTGQATQPDFDGISSCVEELESGSDDEEVTASSSPEIPTDFAKLLAAFIDDIAATFPEYRMIINKWWGFDSFTTPQVANLFAHCMNVYPPRFTDIIYQNVTIFSDDSTVNVDFLPGISFKFLWNCDDVSEVHRTTIWKYLQMVLLSVLGTLKTDTMSEDMKTIFDTMSEDNIKNKLQDTIENIQSVFDAAKNTTPDSDTPDANMPEGSTTPDARTTAEGMQAQIDGLMGGKLGELAQEIAEETAEGLDMGEFDGSENVTDVFKKMFNNPGKFMNLVTNVTNKLDSKMKSGEFQSQDLMQEATGILQNMKDIPGMGNIQEMMGNMTGGGEGGAQPDMAGMANMVSSMMGGGEGGDGGGVADLAGMMGGLMGGLKPGQKIDTNAMERQEKRTNKITQMKQRIEKNKLKQMVALQQMQADLAAREQAVIENPPLTNDELEELFNDSGVPLPVSGSKSKKKKGRSKK